MKLEPIKKYYSPAYPQKQTINENPELLKIIPQRWEGKYYVGIALSALLIFTLAGCENSKVSPIPTKNQGIPPVIETPKTIPAPKSIPVPKDNPPAIDERENRIGGVAPVSMGITENQVLEFVNNTSRVDSLQKLDRQLNDLDNNKNYEQIRNQLHEFISWLQVQKLV